MNCEHPLRKPGVVRYSEARPPTTSSNTWCLVNSQPLMGRLPLPPPINSSEVRSDYCPIPFLQMLQGAMQSSEHEPGLPFLQMLTMQPKEQAFSQEQHDSCITHASESQVAPGRRKRKRPRAPPQQKKAEEAESQRLSHIAMERNRRKLMNEHLAALGDLMPPSYVQRNDQASVIGQAINFVKELEQRLLSLQAEKRLRSSETTAAPVHRDFFVAPQYRREEGEEGMDVEATVVQGHVNLKVAGRRRAGQLVQAVAAMEELGLTVLHFNINALDADASVLYCFNLKMEEGCRLASADEIAAAAHQIFAYINHGCCTD